MTIEEWLKAAVADAERRGLPELKPMLEALARATGTLRGADFNESPLTDVEAAQNAPPGEHTPTESE